MAHSYFHIEDGFEQYDRRKWPLYLLAIVVLFLVVYGVLLLLSPKLPVFGSDIESTAKYYQKNNINYIKISRINLITNLESGETPVLEKNVWLKSSSTPKDSGPIEIIAKGFQLSLTPESTKQKSPFHLLDKLQEGDAIEVGYDSKTYGYRVKSIKSGLPNDADKQKNTLWLYAVKAINEPDESTVVLAEPINPIEDTPSTSKTPIL